MTGQFESHIKKLLEQHETADVLRNLSSNSTTIEDSVNSMLIESSIASIFDVNGYEFEDTKQRVIDKLKVLISLLRTNLVEEQSYDFIVVNLIMNYVNNGYSLTEDAIDCLNKIYKKYA